MFLPYFCACHSSNMEIHRKSIAGIAALMLCCTAGKAEAGTGDGDIFPDRNEKPQTEAADSGATKAGKDFGKMPYDGKELKARAYFKDGKFNVATGDGKFRIWLDNRIYTDASFYIPTEPVDGLTSKINKDLEEDDGAFRFSNGVSIRRARFAIKAELYGKWFAEFDLDFAYNEIEIKDMYLGYRFNEHLSLQAGHFKEPMSIERVTSSRYITANERPMPVEALAGGRRLGVAATWWGKYWWVSGGIFGQQVDIIQKERNRGSDGFGFTGRVAVPVINNGNMTLHIGGYASWRRPDAGGEKDRTVLFRTFPESRTDRRRFLQAEVGNVSSYATYGAEVAFRWSKFLAYGEYIFTDLKRYRYEGGMASPLKNAEFAGWYATASWMILGQQRHYSQEDAEFGGVKVDRKGGNLELSARISHLNLNDFHDMSSPITGGMAYSYSANLNWYPVSNVLVGLNYLFMDNDKYADSKGQITAGNRPLSEARPGGIDFHVLQLRLMVSF